MLCATLVHSKPSYLNLFRILKASIKGFFGDIAVFDNPGRCSLQCVSRFRDMTQVLKDGEESKQKTYGALCCASRRLTDDDVALVSGLKNVTLKQKTPIRVLHR